MPPLDPDVAALAPSDSALTPYDQEHAVTYMRLLDPEREPDRARRAFDSHLARARWMTRYGYRLLLQRGWPSP